jgi:hypothetical protein
VYLAKYFDNVVMALDPDATNKAIEFRDKYSLLFRGNFSVLQLSKDPKDMNRQELKLEIEDRIL